MKYVTRTRVHVDRIATAWAIRHFVDPDATFEFVSRTSDIRELDGIPFDIRGAELSHHAGKCTFQILIEKYELTDPALPRMAELICAVDLPHDDSPPPEAAGLLAIFDGIRDGSQTDVERLERGAVVCDALYQYCRRRPD